MFSNLIVKAKNVYVSRHMCMIFVRARRDIDECVIVSYSIKMGV